MMKKDFLFGATSSFALEPRFLAFPFFQNGSIPIKKALFASVLTLALAYSTAAFGMEPPAENENDNAANRRVSSIKTDTTSTDQDAQLIETIKKFYALCRRIPRGCVKEDDDAEHVKTLELMVKFYNLETYNKYHHANDKQEGYEQAFVELTKWGHRGPLITKAEYITPVPDIYYQIDSIKETYHLFISTYSDSLVFYGKPLPLSTLRETTDQPLKKTKEKKPKKMTGAEPSKTIAELLKDERAKKENKTLPLLAKKSLPLESQTPVPLGPKTPRQALDLWIDAQKYNKKPTPQYNTVTNLDGSFTTKITLVLPGTHNTKGSTKIATGTGHRAEAKTRAERNLLDMVEGRISTEKKKERRTPKTDTSKPVGIKNPRKSTQAVKPILVDIHTHLTTFDVTIPEIAPITLPKPHKGKKAKEKAPTATSKNTPASESFVDLNVSPAALPLEISNDLEKDLLPSSEIVQVENQHLKNQLVEDEPSQTSTNQGERIVSIPQVKPPRKRTVSSPPDFFPAKVKRQEKPVSKNRQRTVSMSPAVVNHKHK